MDSWWFTDLPNWLVAVGTVGAFGTGGVVLIRELGRDREREAAETRQQATAIAVWPDRVENVSDSPPTIRSHVILNNASFEPIFHLTIEYRESATSNVLTDELALLPPGRFERDMPRELQETWVKSHDGWIRRGVQGAAPIEKPQYQAWGFTVAITFRDSRGRRWRRNADGSIVEDLAA